MDTTRPASPADTTAPAAGKPHHPAAAPAPCLDSQQLLAGRSEVLISHHGVVYRLKQTALGKLILTK